MGDSHFFLYIVTLKIITKVNTSRLNTKYRGSQSNQFYNQKKYPRECVTGMQENVFPIKPKLTGILEKTTLLHGFVKE